MLNDALRVAITADDAVAGVAGCRVYLVNLVESLAREFPDDEYVLVSGRSGSEPWDPGLSNVRVVQVPLGFRVLQRGLWPFGGLPPVDWFTGPVDVVHNTLTTTGVPCRAPSVVTLHDFYPERFPERYSWRDRRGRSSLFAQARRGRSLAISHATANEAASLAEFDAAEITVVHHGVPSHRIDRNADIGAVYGLPETYLLAVSRIDPRKNLSALVRAYDHYRDAGGRAELVIAGGDGTGADTIKAEAAGLGPGRPVRFLGHVRDDDLGALIRSAHVYVYPSTYEGFGLPLLEAMNERVPIAASNSSSIPEVAGEAAVLFDPLDPADMAAALLAVDTNPATRERLIAAMPAQLAKFDWADAARRTRAVYAQAAAQVSQ